MYSDILSMFTLYQYGKSNINIVSLSNNQYQVAIHIEACYVQCVAYEMVQAFLII